MKYTRREVAVASLGAIAAAETKASGQMLPSQTYRFGDLPVHANGPNKSRPVLNGLTHSGFPVEMHLTELGPGEQPHPPHHHAHEEMILIHEGTMAVTISGKTVNLGPGSSAFVASNEEHGWRNVGDGRALYFVVALGED